MIVGLYAAANGMRAQEDRHAVIANNIANVATPGFRRQVPVQKGFSEYFLGELGSAFRYNNHKAPGGGAMLIETFTDPKLGTIVTTGNKLNAALEGPGFIAVDTPQGERFTRQGVFTVDVDGQLATPEGYKVQNADGDYIDADADLMEISENGDVFVDGLRTGQIRLVEFEDIHMLTREGDALYAASDDALAQSADANETRVMQGTLEQASVAVAREMSDMLMGLRSYEANQKVILAIDSTLSTLIDRVGGIV